MVVLPGAMPVTTPVVAFTVAVASAPPPQVPPGIDAVKALAVPVHMPVDPVTDGTALTLMVRDTLQLPIEYDKVPVPVATPVTTPVADPTDIAAPVVLHVPPVTASVSVVTDPAHTVLLPAIDVGVLFTVTGFVAEHPAAV